MMSSQTIASLSMSICPCAEQVKVSEEQKSAQTEEQQIPHSTKSMKTLNLCNHLLLLLHSVYEEKYVETLSQLLKTIYQTLVNFPENILSEVKNMPLYMEILDAYKYIFSFFTFIFKKGFAYQLIENIDKIIGCQVRLIKNIPSQATMIRKDILNIIKFEISEISNMEKIDREKRPQFDSLYAKKNLVTQKHTDDFLNLNVIVGKGKLSKELAFNTRQLLFTFISSNKDSMTLEQLKKTIQILAKYLQDPSVTLTIQNTMIYILYRKHEEFQIKSVPKSGEIQLEIVESLIKMIKNLSIQTKIAVEEFANFKQEVIQQKQNSVKWMNDQEQKNAPYQDLFFNEDYQFIDYNIEDDKIDMEKIFNSFHFSHFFDTQISQNQQQSTDYIKSKKKYSNLIYMNENQLNEYVEAQKDFCIKLFKNVVSFIDTLFLNILDLRQTKYYNYHEMKLLRKLLIYGSRVIQNLYELAQYEREKCNEVLKKFARIFQQMRPLQFRDLFSSVEDDFFGMAIEVKATKGDTGINLLIEQLILFQPQQAVVPYSLAAKYQDDQAAFLLEIFFGYIQKKMRIFNKAMENEKILTSNKMDKRFAKLPTPDLQDTLQKLTLMIGEKALSKKNDQRMKNLFFSVFVTCIKYTKASQIVPYYILVIRNLFKVLCNLNDNSNFVKEFIPMIQGLLETFMQAKEEAAFIKETNEICYSVPAKLKSLIEYLPIISRPLIDSMKSNNIELIEGGINQIQMWVSALSSYPEILDPVIANILPELNSLLYKILYLLPNYTFKLLGKLGAKSRLYYEDKEFKSKNLYYIVVNQYSPEDGLKIDLEDKHTGRQIVLGIDSAIDVVLLKIFDSYYKYSQQKLLEAYKLVKSSFLCFVEPDVDIDYLIASIVNAKNQNNDLLTAYAFNSTKYFDTKKTQIKISALGKGSESHAFEKILKCLLIACSLPKNNPETAKVNQKVKKFFKWVTQYFTLIYICKNGKLKENLVNEISPLVFIENICDFLYYNMLQGMPKHQQRSYFKGAISALKTMIRMVKEIYGDDEEIYENLEFLQILIQKICHLSYGQDLPKKVAANIALQIIIKELPRRTIRFHWQSFMDSLFHILNSNNESLIYQVEKECKNTLDKFFEKVGLYQSDLLDTIDERDKEFYHQVLDKILHNVHQNKVSARNVSMFFIETISRKSGHSVAYILQNVQCSYYTLQYQQYMQQTQAQSEQSQHQDRSWAYYYVSQQIEGKAKTLFNLFKGGYTQVLGLISYMELFSFLFKHKIIDPFKKIHVYLAICEQLLKILEDEVDKFDSKNDNLTSFNNDITVSQAAKSAVKYMKLEKHYISQNKSYDPYSHTLHPHHFLQNQHFEVEELAKRDKLASEIESVTYSYNFFEIFQQRFSSYEQVNPKATEQLRTDEFLQFKNQLQQKINEFIAKILSSGIRASDISFDYVHHIYELYPNHRLHTELISKCLQILCDLSTEDKMYAFFKERQQAFFDQQPNMGMQNPQNIPAPNTSSAQNPSLSRRIDLYAVEIKSKIIVVYFKFFQREEKNIYKTAKKCLTRLLKKETNQQEALPNQILKECVRPSLNILSQRNSFPALYSQLTRLINVLHGCFNEQLGRHLIKCYENNKEKVLAPFQLNLNANSDQMPSDSNQAGEPTPGGGQPNPEINQAQQQMQAEKQRRFNEEFERLIMHQNMKIEDLEVAHHIIKILYLLSTSRQEIYRILTSLPDFEQHAIQELERQFEENYQKLLEFYQLPPIINYETSIRPLSVKLGILKSDFRRGLAKFYNKSPYDSLDVFKQITKLTPVVLDILNEPASFSLRERVSRDTDIMRNYLNHPIESNEFEVGMRLVSIFLKYNKNFLVLYPNQPIIEKLMRIWMHLSDIQIDDFLVKFQNLAQIRRNYEKIQKALIEYCRNPKAKIQVVFSLIKGYRYQSLIDMTPTKLFLQFEIPNTFSLKKKKEILLMTLEKIKIQQGGQVVDELKFMTFELALMHIIIKHSKDQQSFKELVDQNFMQDFIETFFGMTLIQTNQGSTRMQIIDVLRQNLEVSQVVSYEQFQIEIIKVINLFFEYYDFQTIQNVCPQREVQKITQFLYQCAKKASNNVLKEWAFFTLTQMFVKILGINSGDQDVLMHDQSSLIQSSEDAMIKMVAQSSEQILMLILQHGVNLQVKALVQKAFGNLLLIFQDPRIVRECKLPYAQNNTIQADYVTVCLTKALIFEGRNTNGLIYLSCFILGHKDSFYRSHLYLIGKMHKVIIKFGAQLQLVLAQKQLVVELSAVIIEWISRRISNQDTEGRVPDEQINQYQQIIANILFQIIKTCVIIQLQQTDLIKEFIDLSNQCLKQIVQLVQVFPNLMIHFPLFERILGTEVSEKEYMKIAKQAVLNISYILIKYQKETQRFKEFFFDNLVNANIKHQKGVLFVCKIMIYIIQKSPEQYEKAQISNYISTLLQIELKKCLEENIQEIQNKIKGLEDRCPNEKRILLFQDVALLIQQAIPHFTIRFLCALDTIKEKNEVKYTDNEFQFLKDLAQAIFRVVGYFRKQIIFDQMEVSFQKLRMKHNVVHQAANCTTQYTPPELIILQNDILELKQDDQSNYDLFNKETIMMGLWFLVKRIKKMKQEESIQILEIIQYAIQTLLKYNTNEYIIEWLRKIIDVLLEDEPGDISCLLMEQKASFVQKMLTKITEIQNPQQAPQGQTIDKKENPHTTQLIEALFEQSVRFLEKQPTFLNEQTSRLFERVFINSKGKSVALKQRVFKVYEKLVGTSLFKKLQYFFSKNQMEEQDRLTFYQSQSQLLDFTLYNFKSSLPLRKTQYSSRLFPLYNISIKFENQLNLSQDNNRNQQYLKLSGQLQGFAQKINKYKTLKLNSLMDPLSEIISINPNHSTDKLISDKLFIKLFWQYWNLISREEQQQLSESINIFFKNTIPIINNQDFRKYSFPKTFLESVAALSPQIRLEPEILQFLGKSLNLWHVTIPILENHITLYPENERYIFALNELYSKLAEDDYIAGLRRLVTDSKATRSIVSYGQHQMWEEINQQFNQFVVYYAEQEGIYAQMDREYNIPGKYQRQIPLPLFQKLQSMQLEKVKNQYSQNNSAFESLSEEEKTKTLQELEKKELERLNRQIEETIGANQRHQYPKSGPNNKVKEIDLRIWETLFIESLKVLNKWDQYRDIAHALSNQEMMIEYQWNTKDWRNLAQYEAVLKKSESIKYQLYYIYLIIQQQNIHQFDDSLKQVIQLSYKEWDQYLPSYVDNIQFENLIMFQLVMESSEGGRNMIKEASNLKQKGKLADLKTAINIWRERVPHQCESIQMWKEVLENRNFIQLQISHIICPATLPQSSQQLTQIEIDQQRNALEQQRLQFVNEYLDISWNYYKLAQISRKQGLPQLALSYIQNIKNQISASGDSEGIRYEKFKCEYEQLKLILDYNKNIRSFPQQIEESAAQRFNQQNSQNFEPWQQAEIWRLFGSYYLRMGKLDKSKQYLTQSLELNKKEAKTWLAYAKLNQTVFEYRKDEVSLQNSLKGYLSSIILNLPKSRLIIPQMLKLIKRKDLNNEQFKPVINYMRVNIDQMPTWIWIFWIPQLLHMFFSHCQVANHPQGSQAFPQNPLELNLSTKVLEKLCKLYPQAIYYPLKLRSWLYPIDEQLAQVFNNLQTHLKRAAFVYINICDKISSEFFKNLKSTAEEELHIVLSKILCMSQFFKIENFERDFSSFLEQINQKFFREENLHQSPLMSELYNVFYEDFINTQTKENDSLETIKRLKNLKDFLHKKLSLAEQKTNLEQISPYLANFNEKGIELPGQYMISDQEPVPQNIIYIQKFEPVVYRGGVTTKKIAIKGSNQKVYAFTLNHIQGKEDYSKHCSEERVLQIKMIMNQIFQRHKETLRRGVKFYVPIKAIMYRSKLSQDDLQFANLQEIHDYLFQERGLDSDLALNLQIQKVEDIFKEMGANSSEERMISAISQEKKRQINEETFSEMKNIYCQPYLLSSFFHRIFYNVDDLFIFRKQFTTYHSVNSFFSYIFSQVEFSTLNMISFCKTSGRLNFNDAKPLEFLKNKYLKQHVTNTQFQGHALDFESLERDEMHLIPHQWMKSSAYLPFRLTNNLVNFIGQVGLNGLFAGVMTSCSLALSEHPEKIIPLIHLVFRDEINDQKDNMITYINHSCEYLKFKINSLSVNKRVIDLEEEGDKNGDAAMDEPKDDKYVEMGNFKVNKEFLQYEMDKPNVFEEFNKKVFDLVEIAMDEKRLCQMPSNWNAWF